MHNKLYTNPKKYLDKRMFDIKEDLIRWKTLYYIFNILMILGSAATAIITTIIISALVWGGSWPLWYIYLSSGIAASTTFFTSILNFFFVKEKLTTLKQKLLKLEINKLKLENDRSRQYEMFIHAAAILDNETAIIEVNNE